MTGYTFVYWIEMLLLCLVLAMVLVAMTGGPR